MQGNGFIDNKKVAYALFEKITAGDIDGVMSLFARDATFWAPSRRQTLSVQEFGDALRWVRSRLLAPIRYEVGVATAEDDRVSVLVESFATTVEGRNYNNVYNFYFQIEGGLIRLAREYSDTAHTWATLRNTDPI